VIKFWKVDVGGEVCALLNALIVYIVAVLLEKWLDVILFCYSSPAIFSIMSCRNAGMDTRG